MSEFSRRSLLGRPGVTLLTRVVAPLLTEPVLGSRSSQAQKGSAFQAKQNIVCFTGTPRADVLGCTAIRLPRRRTSTNSYGRYF